MIRKTLFFALIATVFAVAGCGQNDDPLDDMVREACDELHAAWDRGDHEAVEEIMPALQERAAAEGYGPREVGDAFEAQCNMPG